MTHSLRAPKVEKMPARPRAASTSNLLSATSVVLVDWLYGVSHKCARGAKCWTGVGSKEGDYYLAGDLVLITRHTEDRSSVRAQESSPTREILILSELHEMERVHDPSKPV